MANYCVKYKKSLLYFMTCLYYCNFRQSKEQHMRKVHGRHKVNYSHAQDKKFKRKNRHNFEGRKNKKK